jgi:hypothetical protein
MTPPREPVREAVGAGVRAFCRSLDGGALGTVDCGRPCQLCREGAPAAIVAFLNAPPPTAQQIRLHLGEVSAQGMRDIFAYHRWLAAAVERAAKGGGDE